jgi:predicted transposase YdaD
MEDQQHVPSAMFGLVRHFPDKSVPVQYLTVLVKEVTSRAADNRVIVMSFILGAIHLVAVIKQSRLKIREGTESLKAVEIRYLNASASKRGKFRP